MDIWSIANRKKERREDEELLRYMAVDRSLVERDHEVEVLRDRLLATRVTAVLIIAILLLVIAKLEGWA